VCVSLLSALNITEKTLNSVNTTCAPHTSTAVLYGIYSVAVCGWQKMASVRFCKKKLWLC